MNVGESKFLNKHKKKNCKNVFISFVNKVFIVIIITLGVLITVKAKPDLKDKIKEAVFEKNFSFAKINKWYKDKFGSVIPIENITNKNQTTEVFNDKLSYTKSSVYKDGVKLTVDNNYLIPILNSGIVVFAGEKEGYGYTIIVQQIDGVDAWYGNVTNANVKLYDYVNKGSLLGNSKDNILYLAFQKDSKFIDYKNYI
mgnify:CR=1 FL=1